jgi:molybdenum ABC transporter molybdate-binding protein
MFAGLIAAALIFLWVSLQSDSRPAGSADGAQTLMMYCAAGLKLPVEAIRREYESEYGVSVLINYEGSGTLLSKLKIAPHGDLFLAADESYIALAQEQGLVEEEIPLATMQPVIAVSQGNPRQITGVKDLQTADVRFGLANPEAAAIGKITRQVLLQTGQWDKLYPKAKVLKPTVSDLANDLKLKTIDAAIIWDAVANQYPELEVVRVPEFKGQEKNVTVGVLNASGHPTAALHFARFLSARDRGLQTFKQFGYDPVPGDVWADTPELIFFSGGVNRLAVQETLREFERREGTKINTNYNGCGILVGQMKAGEIPDAYFACDVSFITQVGDLFDPRHDIATTDIVILTQKDNPKNLMTLGDLTREGLRLGIPNAQQSALGRLSMNLLEAAGLTEAVMKNVKSQTPTADLLVNQMLTGSLDAVLVYKANAANVTDKLTIVPIADSLANAIQPYAVSVNSDHRQLMYRLLDTLRSTTSRHRFKSVGFRWLDEQEMPK